MTYTRQAVIDCGRVDNNTWVRYNGAATLCPSTRWFPTWSAIMRSAKSDYRPKQNGLLIPVLLIGILLAGGVECRAVAGDSKAPAKAGLPPDLDLVPRDAVGFVHLRAADLWRTDLAKDLRY